jgi:large subunit ribosomal protein L17
MSMLRGLVTATIEKERLETTVTRAKDTAALVEKMITLGKEGTLASRRRAMSFITKEDAVKKLFEELAPRFADRAGGYTRVTRLGPRRGDAAEMAVLEVLGE